MKNICSLGVHNQVADEEPAEAFNLFWVSTSLVAKRVRSPKLWCSLLSLRYVARPTVVTRRRRERKRQKSRSRRWYAMVHCCAPCCSDTMCSDGFAKSENTGVDGRIRLHEDQAGYQKFHSLSLYFWICQLPDGKPSLLVCFFAYRSYRWGDWPFLSASQWTSDGEANIWQTSRSEAPSVCAQLSAPAVPPALPCYRSLLQKKTVPYDFQRFMALMSLTVWLSAASPFLSFFMVSAFEGFLGAAILGCFCSPGISTGILTSLQTYEFHVCIFSRRVRQRHRRRWHHRNHVWSLSTIKCFLRGKCWTKVWKTCWGRWGFGFWGFVTLEFQVLWRCDDFCDAATRWWANCIKCTQGSDVVERRSVDMKSERNLPCAGTNCQLSAKYLRTFLILFVTFFFHLFSHLCGCQKVMLP